MVNGGSKHSAGVGPDVQYLKIIPSGTIDVLELKPATRAEFGGEPIFDGAIINGDRPVVREVVDKFGNLVGFAHDANLLRPHLDRLLIEEYGFRNVMVYTP